MYIYIKKPSRDERHITNLGKKKKLLGRKEYCICYSYLSEIKVYTQRTAPLDSTQKPQTKPVYTYL